MYLSQKLLDRLEQRWETNLEENEGRPAVSGADRDRNQRARLLRAILSRRAAPATEDAPAPEDGINSL